MFHRSGNEMNMHTCYLGVGVGGVRIGEEGGGGTCPYGTGATI